MLELIQPISKRDQVVKAMKEAILSGTVQPGASLVESKIAQQLGAAKLILKLRIADVDDLKTRRSIKPREMSGPGPSPAELESVRKGFATAVLPKALRERLNALEGPSIAADEDEEDVATVD